LFTLRSSFMQLSLFDKSHLAKKHYLEYLSQLDLENAIDALQQWAVQPEAFDRIDEKTQSLQNLASTLTLATEKRIDVLLDLWLHPEKVLPKTLFSKEFQYFRSGAAKQLYLLYQDRTIHFVRPGLHAAEIDLTQKDFNKALARCTLTLQEKGENAYVRQLLGYALYLADRKKEAIKSITFALFFDAPECSASFFPGKSDFEKKYDYLKLKASSTKKALLYLPFALWKDGSTYIDFENKTFTKHLEEKIEQHRDKSETDTDLPILQFNRLLYLAEAERLQLGRGAQSERLQKIREEMKELHPGWFTEYFAILKSFRNI